MDMKAPKQYIGKLRKVLSLQEIFGHETTTNNVISVLKHGLMSRKELGSCNITFEDGGYVIRGCNHVPGKISFHKGYNFIKKQGIFPFLAKNPLLVVDSKYYAKMEKHPQGHPVYDGIIPPEDILAIAKVLDEVPKRVRGGKHTCIVGMELSKEKVIELMELQRQRLPIRFWTPVFCSYPISTVCSKKATENKKTSLYVPEWLEVPEEFQNFISRE